MAIFVKKGVAIQIVPIIVSCHCSEVKVKMDRQARTVGADLGISTKRAAPVSSSVLLTIKVIGADYGRSLQKL